MMPDDVRRGDDPPTDHNLEARVSAVEARLARVEAVVEEIRKELVAIRIDLAEIKGRLANIPTTFQLVFMLAAFTVATFIGATGLSLVVLRLSGAH